MKKISILFCVLFAVNGVAQTNLIPNATFTAKEPLEHWRTAFPYEGWYKQNHNYVSVNIERAPQNGKCAEISLPAGVAGNQGGKIESAFVKAVPGATYKVEVDCMTWDFSAKLHAEAYAVDNSPMPRPSKFRIPATNGLPALVMVYRAQLPDPPAHSKNWTTVSREFTLPATVKVRGEETVPAYLSLKAVAYDATMDAGKSYFTNFRLYKIK
jgi:hypothetical protein